MILTLAIAVMLCMATMLALRPVTATPGPVRFTGFDGNSVLVIFALYVAASVFLGNAMAFSVLAAFGLHEAGHVLAHRMLGRGDTAFRLVPILTPHPVALRPYRNEGDAFFVALMGAGFSLAPMALALTLAGVLDQATPQAAHFLLMFGATVGAVNFLLLMPFGGLDGGVCARISSGNFWPALAPGMTVFMVTAMGLAGIRHGSVALLVMAAFGLHSLLRRPKSELHPMGPDAALVALAAYAMTLAAHFMAGWILFQMIF